MQIFKREKLIHCLVKKVGETPLLCLEKFKQDKDIKLTYAGRLDPMAEGALLVLQDSMCKKKDDFLKLDKEYIFEIVFGIKTDSGDILGLSSFLSNYNNLSRSKIKSILKTFTGKYEFRYPIFSSKPVDGVVAALLAKDGIKPKMPKTGAYVYHVKLLDLYNVNKNDLEKEVFYKLSLLQDKTKVKTEDPFRKKEIIKTWKETFGKIDKNHNFVVAKIKARVSSGFYVRVFAEDLARKVGAFGFVKSLVRTKIGKCAKIPFMGCIFYKAFCKL